MDKQKLDKAIKHARITVKEIQSDSIYYPPKVSIRPHKETNYNYTINIGGLNLDDMKAFADWFKQVNPSWLEGIEQDFEKNRFMKVVKNELYRRKCRLEDLSRVSVH